MAVGDEVRVVLVGLGVRGGVWAAICAEAPGVALVGFVDQDRSAAESVSEESAYYEDVASALEECRADAVVIATPPETHYAIGKAALAAGKHVLCEKPLSENMDEVVDLVITAEARGVQLLVGMNFRYLSTSQRIRQYVKSGELGALSYAQFSYLRHRDGRRSDLNDYPLTMSHPMLFEQSIHHFDLLRYCYGLEVESLVADSFRPAWSSYENDCCVSVLFRFESGLRVNYQGTWTAAWNKMSFDWRSEFASGALVQRSQFDDLLRVDFDPELGLLGRRFKSAEESEKPRAEDLPPCIPFVDDTRLLLQEFVGAIRGELEPTTTGRDHLKSLSIVQAAIESNESGRWVTPGVSLRLR